MSAEQKKTHLAILSGIPKDFERLDFSIFNLRLKDLNEVEINKIVELDITKLKVKRSFRMILDANIYNYDLKVLFPIDFSKIVSEATIQFVHNILLLVSASDIKINNIFYLDRIKSRINLTKYTSYAFRGFAENNQANYSEKDLKSINAFIPTFANRYFKIKYIQPALHSYTSSFSQKHITMEYLNLCIALESTINGNTELNYRIRRNLSVLLSSEVEFARNIYKNIGKIYTLRSKIIHSGKYDYKKVEEYTPYLRNTVSRLITEIISNNIHDLNTLNEILTEKGFGDNKSISKDYVFYQLNSSALTNTLQTRLD